MHEMTQFTTLSSHLPFTISGAEFIMATFNTNIRKVIYVIAIYKPSTLLFSTFLNQLQKLLDLLPTYCPTIIMGDVNIDTMFDQNSTQPNEFKFFYELVLNGTLV
jgi:endonuclease/exonuclease/phosphatase family metal-dependent hydrolase